MISKKPSKDANVRVIKERRASRRKEDIELIEQYKQENERLRIRNTRFIIPRTEEILWYLSMIIGLAVIFGWHAIITM